VFRPLHEPAIRVNDTVFNMAYYIDQLHTANLLQYIGNQELFELVVEQTGQGMVTFELIRQEVKRLALYPSPQELQERVEERVSALSGDGELDFKEAYSNLLERLNLSDRAFRDIVEKDVIWEKLRAHIKEGVPTRGEHAHVRALLLANRQQAEEVAARLEAGEDFATVANEVSQFPLAEEKGGDLGWLPQGIRSPQFDEAAFALEPGAVSTPARDDEERTTGAYWLIKLLESETSFHPQAILVETEAEAEELRARLEAGEDFATLATEHSLHYSAEDGGDLGWLSQDAVGSAFEEAALSLEQGALSDPFWDEKASEEGGYWLIKLLEKIETEIHPQAILVVTEAEAEELKARLEAGEDFATLASEHSLHYSAEDGGDLGWLSQDAMGSAFEEAALSLEQGTLSDPFWDEKASKEGGYWLIELIDPVEEREISQNHREVLTANEFNRWMEEARLSSDIEFYLDEEKTIWAVSKALE